MQVYFIRHAQSANNALWANSGASQGRSEDPELTETGRRQAEVLADFLRRAAGSNSGNDDWRSTSGFHLTHIYTSLMVRAVMTGVTVARALGLRLEAWPDLHECGGIYLEDESGNRRVGLPGKTRAYFETSYPELVLPETLNEAGWWGRPFEETIGRTRRAARVWRELLRRHGGSDDRVAVITHGCFYNHLMSALLKLPWHQTSSIRYGLYHALVRLRLARRRFFWFQLNNAGITRLDFRDDGGAVLVYQNRVDYLPPDLITD